MKDCTNYIIIVNIKFKTFLFLNKIIKLVFMLIFQTILKPFFSDIFLFFELSKFYLKNRL